MRTYSLTHLGDRELLRDLKSNVMQERSATAVILAHIGEVDARKLYLPAGFPSMFEYCVRELHLSEDATLKRIQAARVAREIPGIFTAQADGRLHLSGVVLLAPHLRRENAEELIDAASGKSKAEIGLMLARRFPRTEMLPMVHALPASAPNANGQRVPEPVESHASKFDTRLHAPGHVGAPTPRPKVAPLSAQSFALQVTIEKDTNEKLRYAEALLGQRVPSGDLAKLLDRVLDLAIGQLEKQKFAATARPRTVVRRSSINPRHIPAHVKRAVWERDQGHCTFTSPTGHRCGARKFLEFDHVDPVALGGAATVPGIRLRCRAHNQYEAECTFGVDFVAEKRAAARRAATEARARTEMATRNEAEEARGAEEALAAEHMRVAEEARADSDRDVLSALRTLGFRAGESRQAVDFSASLAEAPLEKRARLALSYLRPKAASRVPATASHQSAPRAFPRLGSNTKRIGLGQTSS